jgi:Zn-dependent protease with chaperone function
VTLAVLRRRNRLRIVATLLIATVLYWLSAMAAAIAVGVVIFVRVLAEGGTDIGTDGDTWFAIGIFFLATIVISAVIGSLYALVRLPLLRSKLERRVLAETGATVESGPITEASEHERVRNILEALAIAADIPPPRFAVVNDAAPNSFAVGTRPRRAIVAVTSGAIDKLSRDELEAVLAYEVTRINSFDVALSSWSVALTGAGIEAVNDGGLGSILGWLPAHGARRLQAWVLRATAEERDRAAVWFTRNPTSLLHALEVLAEDPNEILKASPATAPLWFEVPTRALGRGTAGMLDERIAAVLELAGLEPESPQEQPQ